MRNYYPPSPSGPSSLTSPPTAPHPSRRATRKTNPTKSLRFLPLIPFRLSPVTATPSSIAHGKASSLSLLSALETHLRAHTHLLGGSTQITLADIMVAVYVSRGLEWVLGRRWREENWGIMRHFGMVAEWGPVREVIPCFEMVESGPEEE